MKAKEVKRSRIGNAARYASAVTIFYSFNLIIVCFQAPIVYH
jgi:hypothetical protein